VSPGPVWANSEPRHGPLQIVVSENNHVWRKPRKERPAPRANGKFLITMPSAVTPGGARARMEGAWSLWTNARASDLVRGLSGPHGAARNRRGGWIAHNLICSRGFTHRASGVLAYIVGSLPCSDRTGFFKGLAFATTHGGNDVFTPKDCQGDGYFGATRKVQLRGGGARRKSVGFPGGTRN